MEVGNDRFSQRSWMCLACGTGCGSGNNFSQNHCSSEGGNAKLVVGIAPTMVCDQWHKVKESLLVVISVEWHPE